MRPQPRDTGEHVSARRVGRLPCGPTVLAAAFTVLVAGCGRQKDMPDRMEMPDTMPVMRALENPSARDSMLDSMPGGEMVRGDSAAAMKLLKKKM